ncbi:MAG: response regulator, partial [Sphingomonas sp.]
MSRKILIVEDDAATAAYLAKGLVEAGHSVEIAANGRDGLFLASEGIFDLVIADRMLPGLDGLGMVGALRAAKVETPVLVLSALASVDDRVDGLRAGADDYLCKPFSFAELSARIDSLVRRADRSA